MTKKIAHNTQNDQMTAAETAEILRLVQQSLPADGDAVELGCYRGDTSVLIAQALSEAHHSKTLYIYDSFAGLPAKTAADQSGAGANFQSGALKASRHEVIAKLRQHHLHNVVVKKAWFQDLTAADLPTQVAFALIDGDFYESQKQGLKLVAPLVVQNGLVVCHDYNNPELPGAARAVDEFLAAHPHWQLQARHTLAILRPKT